MVGLVVGVNRLVRGKIFNPVVFWAEKRVAQKGPECGVSLTEDNQKL